MIFTNIYDDLVLNNHKNAFEIALIENDLKPKSNSNFLDIGSGTTIMLLPFII